MDDPEELKALARKCRKLRDSITDSATREVLYGLASDYEQRAATAAVPDLAQRQSPIPMSRG